MGSIEIQVVTLKIVGFFLIQWQTWTMEWLKIILTTDRQEINNVDSVGGSNIFVYMHLFSKF